MISNLIILNENVENNADNALIQRFSYVTLTFPFSIIYSTTFIVDRVSKSIKALLATMYCFHNISVIRCDQEGYYIYV